ncbi:MAG TPA: hypothetical protein VK013_10735 [Myxococcaceae bacterium]|nr:hypothetical protein [Myxococcaceae bacterium]
MYVRTLAATALLTVAGCTATQNPQQTENRQRLANRGIYDVAACHVGADFSVPENTTEATLTGAMLLTRPLVFNCLADPAHRGEAKETTVTLSATVNGSETTFDAQGDNLTEAGRTCIIEAVDAALEFKPVEGEEPVTASMDIEHEVNANGAVVLGINEPSDIVGTIRLAQQNWCDCLGDDPHATPDTFTAQISFDQGATEVKRITLFRAGETPPAEGEGADAEAGDRILTEDPVGQCLAQRLRTVTFQPTQQAWEIPYVFEFINSLSDTPASNATPNAHVQQLDARRAAAQSKAIMVAESANKARDDYAELVQRYNTNRRSVKVPELVSSCEKLTQANDAFIKTIEEQQHAEQRILDFANAQLAEDPSWQELVNATTEMQASTATNLENAKTQREADQAACPKINF